MSFEVYSVSKGELIISIANNNNDIYIHPSFSAPLEKIKPHTCFPFPTGQQYKIFGNSKIVQKGDALYPLALRMFCEAKLLSHPETYTKIAQLAPISPREENLTPLSKV